MDDPISLSVLVYGQPFDQADQVTVHRKSAFYAIKEFIFSQKGHMFPQLRVSELQLWRAKIPITRDFAPQKPKLDAADRIIGPITIDTVSSSFAQPAIYELVQRDSQEKVLDDRPQEDNIPPVSLLYGGFGEFLDIFDGDMVVQSTNDVQATKLRLAVDTFAWEMCKFFESEDARREKGLLSLDKIFAARNDGLHPDLSAARTDGHSTGNRGVATVINKFMNRSTGNSAIPEVELVGCFARSFSRGIEDQARMQGWRVPVLGITVVGPDVKFYAMLNLDTQFRLVSLTPALSCIRSASEGRDRDALYRAFTAASVLHARILKDVTHHQFLLGEFPDTHLPYVFKLRRWAKSNLESDDCGEFQINKHRSDTQHNLRFLYRAETKETPSRPIFVKFVRLPGGLYGVAMEDAIDAIPLGD